MRRRPHIHHVALLIAGLLGSGLAPGCGSGGSSGADARCADMRRTGEAAEGESCDLADDCPAVDCACADGTVVSTRSCSNRSCEGVAACSSACEAGVASCTADSDVDGGADQGDDPDGAAGQRSCTGGNVQCAYLDPAQCADESSCDANEGCGIDPTLGGCVGVARADCILAPHCDYDDDASVCIRSLVCPDAADETECSDFSRYCVWNGCYGGESSRTCDSASSQEDCEALGCSWL